MRLMILGACIGLATITLLSPSRAEAATPPGLDVSWPQCDKPLPPTPLGFAVVGVDGGKAYTTNPCFRQQYQWAASTGNLPSLYMTLRSPTGPTGVRGLSGPAGECKGIADTRCVTYNYGFHAAEAALAYATSQSGAPASAMWWLDVETTSDWSDDTAANVRVVQGAIDFFNQRGIMLGLYSTRLQWNEITDGFTPGLPIWIGGASDESDAPTFCVPGKAFAGGPIWAIQYIADDLDHNVICGESVALTILTRTLKSLGVAPRSALETTPPAPAPPPPAAAVEPPSPPLPPPKPPVPPEKAHVGGARLYTLPVAASPEANRCSFSLAAVTFLAPAKSITDQAADQPRRDVVQQRRRSAPIET